MTDRPPRVPWNYRLPYWLDRLLVAVLIGAPLLFFIAVLLTPFCSGTGGKHASALSDLREIRTAIESYARDHGVYPSMTWGEPRGGDYAWTRSAADSSRPFSIYCALIPGPPLGANAHPVAGEYSGSVTTPVAYVSAIWPDIYARDESEENRFGGLYFYFNAAQYRAMLEAGQARLGDQRFAYAPSPAQLDAIERDMGAYILWSVGPQGWDGFAKNGSRFFDQFDPTNGGESAGAIFVSQRESKPVWVDAAALEP